MADNWVMQRLQFIAAVIFLAPSFGFAVRAQDAGLSANPHPPSTQSNPSIQRAQATPIDAAPTDAGDVIDNLLTRVAVANIPTEFSQNKDWGTQAERFDGLDWEREGLKIETRRKRKWVNHGNWKKYSVSLRNPAEEFRIQIKNMREAENGKLAFEVHLAAHLDIDARNAKWEKGVQLYSVSATGHTQIRLVIGMEMDVRMGVNRFPPDMKLTPHATRANIIIDEFRIDRISKIGGEIAQQVTRSVREQIDQKIAEYDEKLLSKINEELEKHKDDFELSPTEALQSKWAKPRSPRVPEAETP